MNFEEKLNRLDEISNSLSDNISLQDGLKLYEEGVNISKDCLKELKDVKGKISIIKKDIEVFYEENLK